MVNRDNKIATAHFYIGTSGWIYDHWKGLFYPQDLPRSKWFNFYAQHFNAVEVNATFYRRFKDQTYHKWHERAPAGFRYVLKAPRFITHRKLLLHVEDNVHEFCRSANLLGEHLGMILLQVAPRTHYDPERLRNALMAFEDPGRGAVEFRAGQWYCEQIQQLLCEMGAAFCSADSPKNELVEWVTSRRAYIRLHGRKCWYSYNYSDAELRGIAKLALRMAKQGAEDVYIFFNNDFEGYAPKNALQLQSILKSKSH